jgi:hypothetical protein
LALQLPCQPEQRVKIPAVPIKMLHRNRKSRAICWDFFPLHGVTPSQRRMIFFQSSANFTEINIYFAATKGRSCRSAGLDYRSLVAVMREI